MVHGDLVAALKQLAAQASNIDYLVRGPPHLLLQVAAAAAAPAAAAPAAAAAAAHPPAQRCLLAGPRHSPRGPPAARQCVRGLLPAARATAASCQWPPLARLQVLETSGAAVAEPLAGALLSCGFSLELVVAVVDAEAGAGQLQQELAQAQVRCPAAPHPGPVPPARCTAPGGPRTRRGGWRAEVYR
jgi:hypothetical protein